MALVFFLALIFTLPDWWTSFVRASSLTKNGLSTAGVISGFEQHSSEDTLRSHIFSVSVYYPIATFSVDGQDVNATLNDSWAENQKPKYQEGQSVTVRYLAQDPTIASFDSPWHIWKELAGRTIIVILGLSVILTGILFPLESITLFSRPAALFPGILFFVLMAGAILVQGLPLIIEPDTKLKILGLFMTAMGSAILFITKFLWKFSGPEN